MNARKSYSRVFCLSLLFLSQLTFSQNMYRTALNKEDLAELSKLNTQFIKNFSAQDTVAHNKIIHKDFVCIESTGAIVSRGAYMKGWASGYQTSGYTSFEYTDEFIRVFGNMALVRSKTIYTKLKDGATVNGSTIYTDTYIKEKGSWKCVQAQITPIK
jgi:hypothetical protein